MATATTTTVLMATTVAATVVISIMANINITIMPIATVKTSNNHTCKIESCSITRETAMIVVVILK